jgi:hypothetical protein
VRVASHPSERNERSETLQPSAVDVKGRPAPLRTQLTQNTAAKISSKFAGYFRQLSTLVLGLMDRLGRKPGTEFTELSTLSTGYSPGKKRKRINCFLIPPGGMFFDRKSFKIDCTASRIGQRQPKSAVVHLVNIRPLDAPVRSRTRSLPNASSAGSASMIQNTH